MKVILTFLLLSLVVFIGGCGETHTSIQEVKNDGWSADYVEIEVARIGPFLGGVAYSENTNNYAFAIYDKSVEIEEGEGHEHIPVVVNENNIPFEPERGDFLTINSGELQKTEKDSAISLQEDWYYTEATGDGLIIFADDISKADPPADW